MRLKSIINQAITTKVTNVIGGILYGRAVVSDRARIVEPQIQFRIDGREPIEVVQEGGFLGRTFSGSPVELSTYIQLNHPQIGYGGCRTLEDSLKWSKANFDASTGQQGVFAPRNMFINLVGGHLATDAQRNEMIWIPTVLHENEIGYLKDADGKPLIEFDSNGNVLGWYNRFIPEQELLVVGYGIPTQDILGCIRQEDFQKLRDHEPVANEMHQFDQQNLPEKIRARDVRNYASIMTLLLQENKTEKAKTVAARVSIEHVITQSKVNGDEPKHSEMLLGFMKSVKMPESSMEAFELNTQLKF